MRRFLSHIDKDTGTWVHMPEGVPEMLALCSCSIHYTVQRRQLELVRSEPGLGRVHAVVIAPEELTTYAAWVFVVQKLIRTDYGTVAEDQASA